MYGKYDKKMFLQSRFILVDIIQKRGNHLERQPFTQVKTIGWVYVLASMIGQLVNGGKILVIGLPFF